MKKTFNAQSAHIVSALVRSLESYTPDMAYTFDLMRANADIELRDQSGMTPLLIAIKNNQQDIALALIDIGADLTARTYLGLSVMQAAAETGMKAIVEKALQAGVPVDSTDQQGTTALMAAAAHNRIYTMQLLITHKAKLHVKDSAGRKAVDHAELNKHGDAADLLKTTAAAQKAYADFIQQGMPIKAPPSGQSLKRKPKR